MKKISKIILGLGAVAVVFGIWMHMSRDRSAGVSLAQSDVERLSVVLTTIQEMNFEEVVAVSGNVEAKNTAIVSARISGVLDEIFVDEGDPVVAGKTELFSSDKVNLSQQLESAKQQVTVAAAVVRAREATIGRIKADLEKVKLDYERYKRLYEQDHAVTKSAYEAQESAFKQVQAALTEAEAGLALAQAQEAQTKSNLAIAQKNLSDSLVVAPITGKISERLMEPGEMAKDGDKVLRIDDPSIMELTAYLPEVYYPRVTVGETIVRVRYAGADIGEIIVTTKSPVIQPKLRTFEVKALMTDPPEGLVSGARVDLTFVLQKRVGLGAPRDAVMQRDGGLILFTVADDVARMVHVTTGLETNGSIEVFGDDLSEEMPVVYMGQDRLNDGTPITQVEEEAE